MLKLTGHGRPTVYTPGKLGQYYEDLNTGDVYECRRDSKFSPTHGAPVGGYIWELRATGEDIREHQEIVGDQFFEVTDWINEITWDGVIGNNAKFEQPGTIWNNGMLLGTTLMTYYKVSDAIPDISAFAKNDYTTVTVSGAGKVSETNATANDGVGDYDGYYMASSGVIVVYKAGCTYLHKDGPKIPETGTYLRHMFTSMPMMSYEETCYVQKVFSPALHVEPVYKLKPEYLDILEPVYGDPVLYFDGKANAGKEPDVVDRYDEYDGWFYGFVKVAGLEIFDSMSDEDVIAYREHEYSVGSSPYTSNVKTVVYGNRKLHTSWGDGNVYELSANNNVQFLFVYEQTTDLFNHVAEPGLYVRFVTASDGTSNFWVSNVKIPNAKPPIVGHQVKGSPCTIVFTRSPERRWTCNKTYREITDALLSDSAIVGKFKTIDSDGNTTYVGTFNSIYRAGGNSSSIYFNCTKHSPKNSGTEIVTTPSHVLEIMVSGSDDETYVSATDSIP